MLYNVPNTANCNNLCYHCAAVVLSFIISPIQAEPLETHHQPIPSQSHLAPNLQTIP